MTGKRATSRRQAAPRFTPETPKPHPFVPMRAWLGCYVCLNPWWHPIHTGSARFPGQR